MTPEAWGSLAGCALALMAVGAVYLLGPTCARIMRAAARVRARLRARARGGESLEQYNARLEAELLDDYGGASLLAASPAQTMYDEVNGKRYRVVTRSGRRYHVYADRAVYVGQAGYVPVRDQR